jgi:hypothetical protein
MKLIPSFCGYSDYINGARTYPVSPIAFLRFFSAFMTPSYFRSFDLFQKQELCQEEISVFRLNISNLIFPLQIDPIFTTTPVSIRH